MLTKKIKTRLSFLISIIVITTCFLVFIYFNLKQNILYFKTPSEVFKSNEVENRAMVRVGGMVKKDSIQQTNKTLKKYEKEFAIELNQLSESERKLVLEKSKVASQFLASYNKSI